MNRVRVLRRDLDQLLAETEAFGHERRSVPSAGEEDKSWRDAEVFWGGP
jgi:hypothetical protein